MENEWGQSKIKCGTGELLPLLFTDLPSDGVPDITSWLD